MDWKVVAAAPLVIENQLPVRSTYLIWETPKVRLDACPQCYVCCLSSSVSHLTHQGGGGVVQDDGNMLMRQSGAIDSGERVHISSADMRRRVSLQFYPDGYDLVEPQPVVVSEGYSSHQAGVQGKQRLPEKFHVARAGGEPQEIFLDRDIDMEAWQMQDKVDLQTGVAVAYDLYSYQLW